MSGQPSSQNRSFLKAIDGSHLQWNDFRKDVLLPFGITVMDAPLREQLPASLLSFLQKMLETVPEADTKSHSWQQQVEAGQGFNANCTIFPPNILPKITMPSRLQRCQSPKMSREGLPRRSKTTPESLFELPQAKPLYMSAFTHEAFSESEHRAMPAFTVPVGTSISFQDGKVVPGCLMPCPFFTFEHCLGSKNEEVETTLNMCAVSGVQCLKGIQHILASTPRHHDSAQITFSFSCALNDKIAIVNSHTVNGKGQYAMSPLCRFDLDRMDHFQTFQIWVQGIEDWACEKLLPALKDALLCAIQPGMTPPASPMPSLTLSIDTLKGSMPSLMRALRGTHSNIDWHNQDEHATPIMSSVAACGTPWEGRRLQSLALVTTSPIAAPQSLLLKRRHTNQGAIPPILTKPPFNYVPSRPSPMSPHYVPSPDLYWQSDSPCRPYTLSPATPAPDMPWTSKSPMLVLQKRVEVAMNEILELRNQMEALQRELDMKNRSASIQATAVSQPVHETQEKVTAEEIALEPKEDITDQLDAASQPPKGAKDHTVRFIIFTLLLLLSMMAIFPYGLSQHSSDNKVQGDSLRRVDIVGNMVELCLTSSNVFKQKVLVT